MLDDATLPSRIALAEPSPIRCSLMAPTPGATPPPGLDRLIDHILEDYHAVHRQEFPQAIALARKVERVHADAPKCPHGLADHLALMLDELESHQRREEQVLFPMLRAGGGPMARFPIGRMVAEHREVDEQLAALRALTGDFSVPAGACGSWQALTRLCAKLDADLREHMRLENEEVFAPFLD